MEIVPITDSYWSELQEEIVDTGIVIGYEARTADGTLLGRGETVNDTIEDSLQNLMQISDFV